MGKGGIGYLLQYLLVGFGLGGHHMHFSVIPPLAGMVFVVPQNTVAAVP